MPTSIVCTTTERIKGITVSPCNFVLVTDSKDPSHTLGLKMWDEGFHWIQLVPESTTPSTPTTSETEVTDNGN